MDRQRRVAEFVESHGLECPPAYRALDLVSEVGEVAKEVDASTGYGTDPGDVEIADDELGDALFALLALCESVDVDAGAALEESLAKYERRLEDGDDPGSGA